MGERLQQRVLLLCQLLGTCRYSMCLYLCAHGPAAAALQHLLSQCQPCTRSAAGALSSLANTLLGAGMTYALIKWLFPLES